MDSSSFSTVVFTGWPKHVMVAFTSLVIAFGIKKAIQFLRNTSSKQQHLSKTSADLDNQTPEALAALEERKPAFLWNTAMFFPDYHAGESDSTAQQFLWYFSQARFSIRVCIYNFSFPELEYVICKQYERGLLIQFIVGQECTAENLRKKSLPCGVYPRDPTIPSTDQLMHHKFALIDDEAVIVGSMNWTTEGIMNNNENICVSTNRNHVRKYTEEFFRLLMACETAKTYY